MVDTRVENHTKNGYTDITFSVLSFCISVRHKHKQTHTYTMDFNKQQAVKHQNGPKPMID